MCNHANYNKLNNAFIQLSIDMRINRIWDAKNFLLRFKRWENRKYILKNDSALLIQRCNLIDRMFILIQSMHMQNNKMWDDTTIVIISIVSWRKIRLTYFFKLRKCVLPLFIILPKRDKFLFCLSGCFPALRILNN